ncbi:(2Fe-2S)-binding protein [Candidatus Bathyarchaeota archaeon]|nr:(2Fe-2S)-binding protein [Candidatus Bathyarchaeota archaeon]MBT4319053.1 (2Fe-2S)-binding protein [Candidatus Bathyarchaeota archaeon]MBT4424371.1 (2Fe-2S)-binding protein [Candidatus Bathyarchaeota archaeon]MBT5642881.1 (2Fe-2S)-binding protein [Candidatus Bathyarchaeota archaeon]MBT7187828.1 (2Fe-2S)-binding protein [Candidatus Bathyarchaeota archaeon]
MEVNFTLNGEKATVDVPPYTTLTDMLRDEMNIQSVKKGCEHGECGACTLLVNGLPVASCIILAPQVEGKHITTLEGLEHKAMMIDLRQAYIENGAIQCGFCTPGMLISSYALLRDNQNPSPDEVKLAIEGNICRCTGFTKIIEAVLDAAERIAVE